MRTSPIRALLVDDEMLARLALRQALASHPDVTVVGECGTAAEATQAIEALKPDLVFLDIQMPDIDGFKFLHELQPGTLPMVVFATAYAQHALRAFDANALDYLLKPIDQDRFDQMMTRVRMHWHGREAAGAHGPASRPRTGTGTGPGEWLTRVSVKVGEHIRVIASGEIDWIEANGNYVCIHAGATTYLHRETLRQLQDRLDPARFLRVHRAVLVNIDRVREVHPLFNGNAELVLHDGTRIGLSRRFREQARQVLGLR
ncbi:MAG TPA: LytTR family transcriptional regulator DNA-binding domain-containing protein [Steroidobacteraceae bacterium]|nr:LytTR family transcriptional regulator DNA-binding domain-containing protein [Steroidobacteraceae bacterium]